MTATTEGLRELKLTDVIPTPDNNRHIDPKSADIADLAASLGAECRSVYALLDNADPERVPGLIAALPGAIRAEMAALDLSRRDLGALAARLILVHGGDDAIIPPSESRALAAAAGETADLYVVDGFSHVELGFGLIGYALRRMDYPMAPLVLGIVLGDILDKSLRRGLVLTDGDLIPFFTRPISAVIWVAVLLTVLLSFASVRGAVGRLLRGRPPRDKADSA